MLFSYIFFYFFLKYIHPSKCRGTSFKNVRSYKIYYGEANEQVIEGLSKYDMVIIEPYAFSKEQVQQLKNQEQ